MRSVRFIGCILLWFFMILPVSAQQKEPDDFYTLSMEKSWTYVNEEMGDTTTVTISDSVHYNNHIYYGYKDSADYYLRVDGDSLFVWIAEDSTEVLEYDFSADTGDGWSLPQNYKSALQCWASDSIFVVSANETIKVQGQTYTNSIHFGQYPICYDAGVIRTWFVKGVGKVRYVITTITGQRVYQLIQDTVQTGLDEGVQELNFPDQQAFRLLPNYPNPFNPATTIRYTLHKTAFVEVEIVDVSGRLIRTFVQREQTAGNHSFIFDAGDLSSGIYVYRLRINGEVKDIGEMSLVK